MTRLTRNLLLAASVLAGTLLTAFQADASSPICIRQASVQYRDAVRQFDNEVSRSRFPGNGNRFDVRRLRQLADRFTSAVNVNNDYFRYAGLWQDLAEMHFRVEDSLVAGCRQADPRLFRAWADVAFHFDRLSSAVRFQAGGNCAPFGRDPFGRDRFGNDTFGRDRFGNDPFGRDRFGNEPFGHDPFRAPFSAARPPMGPFVAPIVPIRPVHPLHGHAPHVDPRREAAAAITGAILNRLFN
jgi:hypothetical protein